MQNICSLPFTKYSIHDDIVLFEASLHYVNH